MELDEFKKHIDIFVNGNDTIRLEAANWIFPQMVQHYSSADENFRTTPPNEKDNEIKEFLNSLELKKFSVFLRNPWSAIRCSAAFCLGFFDDLKATNILIRCLKDKERRPIVIRGLMRQHTYSDNLLFESYMDDNIVRLGIVSDLGEIKNKYSVDALILALKDPFWGVRFNALESLKKIGDTSALEHIEVLKDDRSVKVSRKAKEVLNTFNLGKNANNVPNWGNWLMEVEATDKEQRDFYEYFSSQIEEEQFVDLGDNVSYVFAYLRSIILDFIENEDIEFLCERVDRIMEFYGMFYDVKRSLIDWKTDAYLFLGDYLKALEIKKEALFSLSDIETFGILKDDTLISGDILVHFKSGGLTDWGIKNKTEIAKIIDKYLNDFIHEYGKNVVSYFLEEFSLHNLNEENLAKLSQFFESDEKFFQAKNGLSEEVKRGKKSYLPHFGYYDFKNLSKKDMVRLKENFSEKEYSEIMDEKQFILSYSEFVDLSTLNKRKMELWKTILEKNEFLNLKNQYQMYKKDNLPFDITTVVVDIKNISLDYNLENIDKLKEIFNDYHSFKQSFKNHLCRLNSGKATIRVIFLPLFDSFPQIVRIHYYKFKTPYVTTMALENELKRIIRESENEYREIKGIPRVGEGWINETELYYRIKESFPDEYIIQHGRPSWLGKQHLDIYFPEKNIVVEYQGEQHNSSIDFFGGDEGFINRHELDKRKKELCHKNKCTLIYVYPEYKFRKIKEKIDKLLKNNEEESLIKTNKTDIQSKLM